MYSYVHKCTIYNYNTKVNSWSATYLTDMFVADQDRVDYLYQVDPPASWTALRHIHYLVAIFYLIPVSSQFH